MRHAGGVIVSAAVAVAATHSAQAFLPPTCASSWRTASATGATAHASTRNHHHNTCSAVDNRRPRRPTMRASVTGNADIPGTDANDATDALALEKERMEEEQEEQEEEEKQVRWAGVRRSLRRGAASLATLTFGATAFSGLSAEVQHRLGGAVSMPAAMKSAQASVFKPFEKRTVEEKLGNIPAFMVTNLKGSPYLSPSQDEGYQLAVFFTNLDDAKEMLREMVQSDSYAKDARILVVSMEKAYGMVKKPPMETGYKNDQGQEESMRFKLERDMHSIPKAKKLGLEIDPSAMDVDIPVFYAEGLEIKRDGSLVNPLFMDPADLLAAWNKAAAETPDMPEKPTVKVYNLPEVIILMEVSDDLKDFGFFASSEGSEFIRQGRQDAKPLPKPRLGRMWSF